MSLSDLTFKSKCFKALSAFQETEAVNGMFQKELDWGQADLV